jgi:hypothetical protein
VGITEQHKSRRRIWKFICDILQFWVYLIVLWAYFLCFGVNDVCIHISDVRYPAQASGTT